jgi:hypothetical protein
MDITELGMTKEVKSLLPEKAYSLMDLTVLGMVVLLHPLTSAFVIVAIMALQFSRESYTVLPLST